MSKPWLQRELVADQARTHALVIGVSAYRNLPDEPDFDDLSKLGLAQAKTPASSAFRFARWLRDEYHNPTAPLGTLRLLLSPSGDETGADPEVARAARKVPVPDRQAVEAALQAWRQDCLQRPDDVAILYAGGHGVQTSKEGSIILLEDFAAPGRNLLDCTLDVGGVRAGMSRGDAAQTQFYFVDSCRIRPEHLGRYFDLPGGLSLDNPVGGSVRVSAVFFGASAGTAALGDPARGTLFCQALLDCLRLHAVVQDVTGDHWVVSSSSLQRELPRRVSGYAREYDAEQRSTWGGEGHSDVVLHRLQERPRIPLTLRVRPGRAAPVSFGRLWDGDKQREIFANEPFDPEIIREVEAGIYSLDVEIAPPTPQYRTLRAVPVLALPQQAAKEVSVK